MRQIEESSRFRKDWKRVKKGQNVQAFLAALETALNHLVADKPLPPNFLDHPLKGDWAGFRECHLRPDLLLIYKKTDNGEIQLLRLMRLGSHAELFGK